MGISRRTEASSHLPSAWPFTSAWPSISFWATAHPSTPKAENVKLVVAALVLDHHPILEDRAAIHDAPSTTRPSFRRKSVREREVTQSALGSVPGLASVQLQPVFLFCGPSSWGQKLASGPWGGLLAFAKHGRNRQQLLLPALASNWVQEKRRVAERRGGRGCGSKGREPPSLPPQSIL